MYAPIKHMRFDWETETHSFIFDTCECKVAALDSLSDIISSLEDLRDVIRREKDFAQLTPRFYKVRGTASTTHVEAKDE